MKIEIIDRNVPTIKVDGVVKKVIGIECEYEHLGEANSVWFRAEDGKCYDIPDGEYVCVITDETTNAKTKRVYYLNPSIAWDDLGGYRYFEFLAKFDKEKEYQYEEKYLGNNSWEIIVKVKPYRFPEYTKRVLFETFKVINSN